MIGIIGAMASEVDGLKSMMGNAQEQSSAGFTFYSGMLFGEKTVIAQSGIGKVNAALCAQNMITGYAPSLIINTGCAAGVGKGIHIGDMVIADYVVQHDVDTTVCGDPKGFISGIDRVLIPADKETAEKIGAIAKKLGINAHRGIVASGDQFLCSSEIKRAICREFDASAVEMEGAAIGHACFMNRIPFAVLRSISDNGDEEALETFDDFVTRVNKLNTKILSAYFEGVELN